VTYIELKNKQQKEADSFFNENAFFAFDTSQFEKGVTQLNLGMDTYASSLINIGCGGYVLKSKMSDMEEMFKRQKAELKNFQKDNTALIEAIVYELGNHEFCITCDTTEALTVLDLFDASQTDTRIQRAVKKAIKIYNDAVILNN